jgi:hypothetical protein
MTDPAPDADCLERLMDAYKDALEAGRMEDAEAAILEFLALVAQTPDEPTPESLLLDEAEGCEATADWAGAEAAYRRMLARAQAEDNPCTQFRAHDQLAMLHGLLGRHDAALEEARAAVAVARRADLPTLLFMALDGQALYALRTDRVPEALGAVSEALEQMDGGALYDFQRGRALALRAACRAALGGWPARGARPGGVVERVAAASGDGHCRRSTGWVGAVVGRHCPSACRAGRHERRCRGMARGGHLQPPRRCAAARIGPLHPKRCGPDAARIGPRLDGPGFPVPRGRGVCRKPVPPPSRRAGTLQSERADSLIDTLRPARRSSSGSKTMRTGSPGATGTTTYCPPPSARRWRSARSVSFCRTIPSVIPPCASAPAAAPFRSEPTATCVRPNPDGARHLPSLPGPSPPVRFRTPPGRWGRSAILPGVACSRKAVPSPRTGPALARTDQLAPPKCPTGAPTPVRRTPEELWRRGSGPSRQFLRLFTGNGRQGVYYGHCCGPWQGRHKNPGPDQRKVGTDRRRPDGAAKADRA